MSSILSTTYHIAKKDYECNACAWLLNGGFPDGMKIADWRNIVKAKRNGWKVKAGQKYLRQTGIYEGEFYCVKSIPEINDICLKYDVYENYC